MTVSANDIAPFTATDDTLVLASVSSPAEVELLDDWLRRQYRDNPATHVTVLHLPAGNPPPEAVSQLVRELEEQHDRSVVPVRVFWMPESRTSNRSALAGLLAGRDLYRPKESRQRRILR